MFVLVLAKCRVFHCIENYYINQLLHHFRVNSFENVDFGWFCYKDHFHSVYHYISVLTLEYRQEHVGDNCVFVNNEQVSIDDG